MKAARTETVAGCAALGELCELYWPPLYSYARHQGHSVEDAQDLTQAFFTRLLEKHSVEDADPERGRFRSFLLASFKYFVSNERDRERAKKRGGGMAPIALEFDAAEARYSSEPASALTPEALFEQQWARDVLDRVFASLRAECVKAKREATFDQVKDLLAGEKSQGGYAAIALRLHMSEGAIKVLVHRLRRRFRDLLHEEIRATLSDDAEIDDEIRHLMRVLGR